MLARLALWLCSMLVVVGCATRPAKVPGETDIVVASVTLQGKDGRELSIEHAELVPRLGMRAKTLIMTDRYFSDFRVAEDERRIEAYWKTFGFFEVDVAPPAIQEREDGSVDLVWTIDEGERYVVHSVELRHAPQPHQKQLEALISFKEGSKDVDIEAFRNLRHDMADILRREGFGHANVYSRTFIDADARALHWVYYVDAGPKTRIGSIVVEGNDKLDEATILERSGLEVGEPWDLDIRDQAEFDLLDSGAINGVFIRADTDTKFIVPGTAPDTGGELKPEQIDADGNLVPRELPEEINLIVHVVESPRITARVRGGFEIDPTRADTSIGATTWFRNLFGDLHHLVLEGRVGYGVLFEDSPGDPSDFYGEAMLRTVHGGLIGRTGDGRTTIRYRDDLFPGFHLREFTAGPGLRTTVAQQLFIDFDLFFRYGQAVDFGPFSDAERDALYLPDDDESYSGEAVLSVIWDRRDNPLEPLRGTYLAITATGAPGDPIGTHRYALVEPEARGFIPLSDSISLGAKAYVGLELIGDEEGVPLGRRLFGGGAYGFRGYGRHQLSPRVDRCVPTTAYCKGYVVGGRSLGEGSLELRYLPYLAPIGAVAFVDVGSSGSDLDLFESGLSLAPGLGARLRLWYLPMAFDVAYRVIGDGETSPANDVSPVLVFFRVGEAF